MRKKMWKKIIAWILCVCILTQSVPLDAASVSRIARGTELRAGGSQMNLTGTGEDVFLSESTSDKGVVYSVDENGKLVQEETKKEKDSSDKKKGESTGSADTETGSSGSDDGKDGDRGKGDAATGSTGTETGSAGSSESDADKTAADKTDEGKTDADKTGADNTNADKIDADKTGADKTDADKTDADKNDADKTDAGKTDADKTDADKDTSDAGDAADDNGIGGEGSLNSGTVHKNSAANALKDQDGTDGTSESGQDGQDHAAPELYDNGAIRIYNLEQLRAIGTDTALTDEDDESDTFGSGEAVTVDGTPVTYSLDGQYVLMNDITLDSDALWQLPEGFAGTFASDADSETTTVDENAPLYDKATDTIYIYNNYQLMTMALDTAAKEPVMSRDMIAEDFGMGHLVYPDGAPTEDSDSADETAQDYLTYSPEHNYVLVQEFTGEMPEMKAEAIVYGAGDADGREYAGQVIFHENGKEYILIGNEQQLRAIGKTDEDGNPYKVTEPVWAQEQKYHVVGVYWENTDKVPYCIYPGDADIEEGDVLYGSPDAPDKYPGIGKHTDQLPIEGRTRELHMGSKKMEDDSGKITYTYDANAKTHNVNMERKEGDDNDPIYSAWANYIIFRDIDFDPDDTGKTESWDPLMFSGNMEGRKNMAEGEQVTISDVDVKPVTTRDTIIGIETGDEKLDTGSNIGIGFFGTLTNPTNADNVGLSGGTASVKNIKLKDISVTNTMTEVAKTTTVVSGLIDILGGLLGVVGGLLDGLLGGLGSILGGIFGVDKDENILGDLNLQELLSGLFDIRGAAADTFATGGFTGRIIGDVSVSGCDVEGLTISNAKDMTGGFVGNVEGLTEYESLGTILNATEGALEGILNIISGLGLGDLITLLLKNPNLLDVKTLLPTGYKKAKITNCSVSVGNIGQGGKNFAGGFAGVQTGSTLENCSVTGLKSVTARKYAGGFAGLTRDAVIKGLLENLDVQIVDIAPSSETVDCSVEGDNLTVVSDTDYAGGFTGAVANSTLSRVSVQSIQNVQAKGNYAGGVAGRTTIGYGPALAEADNADSGLLGTVSGLLTEVLTGDKGNSILNLVGVKPAKLDGCTVSGGSAGLTVEAKNYAGGLFGQGDGTILKGDAESNVSNILSVHATENYAGGLAGRISTASAVGVLDSALGVGTMLAFETRNVTISYVEDTPDGENPVYNVRAQNYAGGAFGQALGGTVKDVEVSDLNTVQADSNYAGGFIGSAGTGSLVEAGGLDILGLGAVKVGDILAVGEAVVLKVNDSKVTGREDSGFTVKATGNNTGSGMDDFLAGGFVGECSSAEIHNSQVEGLRSVSADRTDGYAGGFVASSFSGGLAELDVDSKEGLLGNLVAIDDLLGAADYLVPEYKNCIVGYTADPADPVQLDAAVSGGFVAEMTGGVIDNTGLTPGTAAVAGIQNVEGTYFAGGFAGYVTSGGLAESGGLSLLGGLVQIGGLDNLISVLEVYIPEIHSAPVSAGSLGLTVKAKNTAGSDSTMPSDAGSAGGYLGYGSGVQVTDSGLDGLRSTNVTPPEPLDASEGGSYFDGSSEYAVTAPKYAGGYVGKLDIGNAASVGSGLSLLGNALQVSDLTEALAVVVSKIRGCDVTGKAGGFSVLANGTEPSGTDTKTVGMAGGYVGQMCGAQIDYSDVHNFAYIIGQEAAGGYVGTLEPGNVASVLGETDLLGLVSIDNNFLSLVESFVPFIRNSSTDSVPCGGAVRAENGSAGGYAGHSLGGQIEGNAGSGEDTDAGFQYVPSEAAAYRIRSVYGLDYAGGFTGLMETASVAETGSLKLLGDLITIDNPLTAAQGVYPVESHTAVYGPLSHVNYHDWNAWVTYVGSEGPFWDAFSQNDTFDSQDELDQFLTDYIYGYHVTSPGRPAGDTDRTGGSAGGYVGKMLGGKITSGNAHDLQRVNAWRAAGGYAGEMVPGSLLSTGSVDLAGLDVLSGSLPVLQTFVPAIETSDVSGYGSGYTVTATGSSTGAKEYEVGYAGGYVGRMTGGQIWGSASDRCSAAGLRKVTGKKIIGGFAGLTEPGTTLSADTATENGLLNQILGNILSSDELLEVLSGMISTIKYADVSAWNDYGYVVDGAYSDDSANTKYAEAAGGFVGQSTATVFGEQVLDEDNNVVVNEEAGLSANNVRTVTGGRHAGGFIGKSSAAGVAEVADGSKPTSLLGQILKLDGIEILDIFRTYIYASHVTGSADSGLEVAANEGGKITDANDKLVYDGNAGGFAGSLLSGDTHHCTVTGLRAVKGLNFTGGFTGYMGKTGLVDADGVDVLDSLLGLGVGVADVIGCQAENCTVTGMDGGFTVVSRNTAQDKAEIAGGFVGYANLGRMTNDAVDELKQVSSEQVAGGFVGRTSHAYLAEVHVDGALLDILTDLLNALLNKLLNLGDLEKGDLIDINLGIIRVSALYDGNAISLTLLGLPIIVSLGDGEQDVLKVTIGDSEIELGYNKETGRIDNDELEGLTINLIKANRSKADGCKVSGIAEGYDVYVPVEEDAGNGGQVAEGVTLDEGFAGGFVGYNDSGLLENNTMLYADVIQGAAGKTGPFSGQSANESVYPSLSGVDQVEENGNTYRIYREVDDSYTEIIGSDSKVKNSSHDTEAAGSHQWDVYTVKHMADGGVKYFTELKDAKLRSTAADKEDLELGAYADGGAKAVLMLDTPTETTEPSDTPEPPEQQDPCGGKIRLTVNKVWKDGGAKDRSPTIILTVHGTLEGAPGGTEEKTWQVTLSAEDKFNNNPNIWRKTLTDLPVYQEIDDKKYYFHYTVTENVPEGYRADVEVSDDGYTITVTNSLPLHEILPGAGGMGTWYLYLFGCALLFLVLATYIRSRTRLARAAAAGSNFQRRGAHDRPKDL